jgi:hypothetical protein
MLTTYRFALCNVAGDEEVLGDIALESDEDAISFGAEVIQDILRDNFWAYSGSVMVITDQKCIVRAAGLGLESDKRQRIFH